MKVRSRGVERSPSRPLIVTAFVLGAMAATAGCGATTPPVSTSSPPGSGRPPASAASTPGAVPASAQPVTAGDWIGFRGDAGRSGVGGAGPVGHPVLNWQYKAKAAVPHNITIVGDQVSFASDDGTAYALDRATGAERWTVAVGAAPLIGPVAGEGRLYFLNGAGAAVALDATNGTTVWTSKTTYDGPSELIDDGGTLYFGTGDGYLVALDAATGAERWKLRPSPSTTHVDNPAAANGIVYAGTDGGGFVAIDERTKRLVWAGDTNGEDTGTASVNEGVAFIGTGIDSPKGSLRAFDAATGALRWAGSEPLLEFPVTADGLVFSPTNHGLVQALTLDTGMLRWSIQLHGKIRPMAVGGHTLYIAADEEKRVYAVDTMTGGKLWQFDVDGSNDCCVAVAAGAVYVATLAGTVYSIGGDGQAITAEPFPSAGIGGPTPSDVPAAELPVETIWSTDLRGKGFAPIGQIAIDPSGRIWAPEAEGDRIAIIDRTGTLLDEWGRPGKGRGEFDFTRSNGDGYGTLAFAPDGSFYVLDAGNRRVQHFDAKRRYVGGWGGFGTGPGRYSDPVGIAVGTDGTVWVLDDLRSIVEHYTPKGKVLGSFDPFAATPDNDGANGLAIDTRGALYVSSVGPSNILVFDQTGTLLRAVGDGAFDGQPTHMAIDTDGRLFVTQGMERGDAPGVLAFGPDGAPLGGFGPTGGADGQLSFPAGIVADGRGGLYVEDSWVDSARLIRFALPANAG